MRFVNTNNNGRRDCGAEFRVQVVFSREVTFVTVANDGDFLRLCSEFPFFFTNYFRIATPAIPRSIEPTNQDPTSKVLINLRRGYPHPQRRGESINYSSFPDIYCCGKHALEAYIETYLTAKEGERTRVDIIPLTVPQRPLWPADEQANRHHELTSADTAQGLRGYPEIVRGVINEILRATIPGNFPTHDEPRWRLWYNRENQAGDGLRVQPYREGGEVLCHTTAAYLRQRLTGRNAAPLYNGLGYRASEILYLNPNGMSMNHAVNIPDGYTNQLLTGDILLLNKHNAHTVIVLYSPTQGAAPTTEADFGSIIIASNADREPRVVDPHGNPLDDNSSVRGLGYAQLMGWADFIAVAAFYHQFFFTERPAGQPRTAYLPIRVIR